MDLNGDPQIDGGIGSLRLVDHWTRVFERKKYLKHKIIKS